MENEKRLDLIDRAKVYECACVGCTRHGEFPGECYHDEPCEKLIFAFTVAEPVDAVEVVHGEWEKYTDDKFMGYGADGRIRERKVYSYKCSKCWNYTAVKHNYCPHCGAKMDGGNTDGNL